MVRLNDEEHLLVKQCISKYVNLTNQSPSEYYEGSFSTWNPHIRLWNPLASESLTCPIHKSNRLLPTEHWTSKNGRNLSPRLVFHLGRNVLFVSSLYKCEDCLELWPASSPDILRQAKQVEGILHFHLFHVIGVSKDLYSVIINGVKRGLSFKGIKELIKDCYKDTERKIQFTRGDEGPSESLAFRCPSENLIQQIFLFDYDQKSGFYKEIASKIAPQEISIDHTFKIR